MRTPTSQSLWQSSGAPGAVLAAARPLRTPAQPTLLGALGRRLTAGRPAIGWSLALLFVCKGLLSLSMVAFPISASEPTGLLGTAGALGIAAGSAVWLFARRIPLVGFELLSAGGSLTVSNLVAHATTHGGMMLAAFAYPWIAIYAAHFFPRRAVVAQGLLISVGFGAGLLLGPLSHVAIYWVVVTATIWSICILLGNLSESLRVQSCTDQLTGLLNRSGFLAAALRERALANRTGAPLSLAVIDLDNFKHVNDSAGHAAGDELLATLGRQWRERLRPSDILARHGGDEFVLLLPCTEPSGARAALERLHDDRDPIGWSTGVSGWLAHETLDDVLARADRDLYEAKTPRTADV